MSTSCNPFVRINIEILKATKVVVVRQRGYVNVESADRIESDVSGLDREPSLTWREGVVDKP